MSIDSDIPTLPDNWFIYAMGEEVKPIIYKGDKHDHITFYVNLQHRNGGRMSTGKGTTLHWAFTNALQAIQLNHGETS